MPGARCPDRFAAHRCRVHPLVGSLCWCLGPRNCSPRRAASADGDDDCRGRSTPTSLSLPKAYQTTSSRNRATHPLSESAGLAEATAGELATAIPTPSATARAQMPPMCFAFSMVVPFVPYRVHGSRASDGSTVLDYSRESQQMGCTWGRHKGSSDASQSPGIESGRGNGVDGSAVRLTSRSQPGPRLCDPVLEPAHRAIPANVLENNQPASGYEHTPDLAEGSAPHPQPSTTQARRVPSRNCCPGMESTRRRHPRCRLQCRACEQRWKPSAGTPPPARRRRPPSPQAEGTSSRYPGRDRPSAAGQSHCSSPLGDTGYRTAG